ncbi:MAG: transglutaminase domain-containing protein [Planctomycetales bacterium]|nr:transglutaminase domain-containing protein [Planctomycetales bacterium]
MLRLPTTSRVLPLLLATLALGCSPAQPAGTTSAHDPVDLTSSPATSAARPRQRSFGFTYAGAVSQLKPGAKARIWLPLAQSNSWQQVTVSKIELPAPHQQTTEPDYGNQILFFEATADEQGEIPFAITYQIVRSEVTPRNVDLVKEPARFLQADQYVPIDKQLLDAVFAGKKKPTGTTQEQARQLYEAILDRMKYDKPAGGQWGRGDAEWACNSRFGNCTDFHSLFMSLCRELKIPAMFEIGFPLPAEDTSGTVAGYHCWAFFGDERWQPVDISEADKHPEMKAYYFSNLTADRVTFSTGRDITLVPPQDGEPLNYFVYPYVEIDGRPAAKEQIEPEFAYHDR